MKVWQYYFLYDLACDSFHVTCIFPVEYILKTGQSYPWLSLSPGTFEKREHLLLYYKTKRLNISWKCTFNKTDIKFFSISRTWFFFIKNTRKYCFEFQHIGIRRNENKPASSANITFILNETFIWLTVSRYRYFKINQNSKYFFIYTGTVLHIENLFVRPHLICM